jgi:hypothetical protein
MRRAGLYSFAAAVLLSGFLAARVSAAETSIFRFLKSPASPRHVSLGEVNSFFNPEPLGIIQNPSLAFLSKRREAAFSGASRLDGSAATFAAAGVLRDSNSGSAAGFALNTLTTSQRRTLAPASAGSYLYADDGDFATYSGSFGGFYAGHIQDTTYFGVSSKLIVEKLYSESYYGVAADVALMEIIDARSMFFLGARNVGAAFSGGYLLPSSAYISILAKTSRVAFAVEGEYDLQGFGEAKLGLEVPVVDSFDVRAGYRHSFREYDTGDYLLSGISAGFGLRLNGFDFDYAWQPRSELGSTHLASVRMKL